MFGSKPEDYEKAARDSLSLLDPTRNAATGINYVVAGWQSYRAGTGFGTGYSQYLSGTKNTAPSASASPPTLQPPKVPATTPAQAPMPQAGHTPAPAGTHVSVNFYGDVHDKSEIKKMVADAINEASKYPQTLLSQNGAGIRSSAFMPRPLQG
jgi:hypothetical protein